jgi:hypothetical protein
MRSAKLVRQSSTDQGTFGLLTTDRGDRYHTGELPWRYNQRGVSCIPPGKYLCRLEHSPKRGEVYYVTNVKDRSNIQIHRGNWCGDKTLGYKSDVLGCILLGTDSGVLAGQRAVLHSGVALEMFMLDMAGANFELEIS